MPENRLIVACKEHAIHISPSRIVLKFALASLAGLLTVSDALAQDASLHLVAAEAGRKVYELTVDWGDAPMQPGGMVEQTMALELPTLTQPSVRVLSASYDILDNAMPVGTGSVAAEVVGLGLARKRPEATLVARLVTYDSTSATMRRYRHMRIEVTYSQGPQVISANDNPHLAVRESVLASGRIFKLAIAEEGIYRIDRAFLEALPDLDVDLSSVDPNTIRVYGNGGAPLPALNGAPRIADLAENQVLVHGGGDGSFDTGDAVWFYARGPYGWENIIVKNRYQEPIEDSQGRPVREWVHYVHPFDSTNYYFLAVGGEESKAFELSGYPDLPAATTVETVLGLYFLDLDEYLWGREGGHSGHTWVSSLIPGSGPGRRLLDNVILPGLVDGELVYSARIAIQSNPSADVYFNSGATTLHTARLGSTSNQVTEAIARSGIAEFNQTVTREQAISLDMDVEDQIGAPQAALDWLRIQYPKELRAGEAPVRFRTPVSEEGPEGTFTFSLIGFDTAPTVLDITEPGAYQSLETRVQGGAHLVQVVVNSDQQPRDLVAFTSSQVRSLDMNTTCGAEDGCRVAAQNLHGIQSYPDFVIITPALFIEQATELANLRRAEGLTVEVVDIQQIYNEFSGGQQDMRGIRDYLKFLYDRASGDDDLLRYVLFFGDGHFDYRNLSSETTLPNHIPPFETEESWLPEASFTSDDYFGLLDDNEGVWPYVQHNFSGRFEHLNERVDLGIGRFTVTTVEEAQVMIDKIKHYESPDTYGPWRSRYLFLADDGPTGSFGQTNDRDLHTQNTDVVAVAVQGVAPEVNQRKVYALSYEREFLNGWRIPKARQDLLTGINEGMLVVNFSGHGSEKALAQENLFTIEDARTLQNRDVLPVVITATCSFGRWDLSHEQSGAEELLLNPDGGAIALLTTVRLVWTSGDPTTLNVGLNVALNKELFKREPDGLVPRMGDALRRTKNHRVGYEGNNRKFSLLGDPTMRLGLPAKRAVITHINDNPVETATGRMRALERVNVRGEIRKVDGSLDVSFDGSVTLTVFDAVRRVPIPLEMRWRMPTPYYEVREDLIWRGRARVQGGLFSAIFVVPKDISYADKAGRISMYVSGAANHLVGLNERFIVGGTAADVGDDSEGPEIELFLGDETFTDGGLTTASPLVLARLYDESGINTVGAGVGHEMLLILDDNEQEAINVGDLYESDENSFQSGSFRYTFESPLEPGMHSLALRAWDVLNNSGTAALDFEVTDQDALAIRNVLNYPNPTTGPTRFVFEHNQLPGTPVSVRVRVYTLSGRPVRTLEIDETLPAGPLQISWDGLDDDYVSLAPGVYLYMVRVETLDTEERHVSEVIEKLSIVR